jgi:hypothetical protein
VLPKSAPPPGPAEISAPLKKMFVVNFIGTKILWEGASIFLPYFDIYIHFFLKFHKTFWQNFKLRGPLKNQKSTKKKVKGMFLCTFWGGVLI